VRFHHLNNLAQEESCGNVPGVAANAWYNEGSNREEVAMVLPGFRAVLIAALGALPAVAAAQQIGLSPTLVEFGAVGVGTVSVPVPITVTNESGSDNLTIDSVTLTGANANQFAFLALSGPKTMLPSESLILTLVTYQPASIGAYAARLRIHATTGEVREVALTGTGVDAQIAVSPMAIDLGTQQVGTTSGDEQVTIANTGAYTLTLFSVQLEGPNADSFQLVSGPAANTLVDANSDLSFYVNCHPVTAGTLLADVLITSSDTATPALRIQLTCAGTVANVQVAPTTINFGSVVAGAGAIAPVAISNTGGVLFSIDGVDIYPLTQTVFSVTLPANPDLGPTQSKSLTFSFDPASTQEGAFDATAVVHLSAGVGDVQIWLHGLAVLPHIAASATTLLFADQRVGTQGQRELRLTNTGGAWLTIDALTGLEAPFALLAPPALPVALAPNETLTLTVAFTPTDAATATGTLAISSDDPAANVVNVDLQGRGIAPALVVTPAQVDFDPQRRLTTSEAHDVTLTNAGSDTLDVSSVALGGADQDAFALTGVPTGALDPGQSRTFSVSFTPPAAGDFTATITITSDDPAQPATTVTLTGSGTAPTLLVEPAEDYSFGEAYVGKQLAPVTFAVTNGDTGPLALGEVRFANAAPDFQLDAGSFAGTTLAVGQKATFTVVFAPQSAGEKTAELEILVAGDGVPAATITLSGTGSTTSTGGGCAAAGGGGSAALALVAALGLAPRRRRRQGPGAE
jgi:MYXO-CTERM domain-containing protein